jgi:Holliday junction resolvase RusA-like endonuclease
VEEQATLYAAAPTSTEKPLEVAVIIRRAQEVRAQAIACGLDVSPLDGWLAALQYPRSSERLTIVIPGYPFAQPRHRSCALMAGGLPVIRNGRPVIRTYDLKTAKDWKAMARHHMEEALAEYGLAAPYVPTGAVSMEVSAYFQCPAGQVRKTRPRGLRRHVARPDLDNLWKAVKDAGKGVLWRDDSQVAEAQPRKFVAPQGEGPRVVLRVWPVPIDVL